MFHAEAVAPLRVRIRACRMRATGQSLYPWAISTMQDETCDAEQARAVKPKKSEVIEGLTIKYHAGGGSVWSRGRVVEGQPDGYWEWFRKDGTLNRSGHFALGDPIGEWTTYDLRGEVYKVTKR